MQHVIKIASHANRQQAYLCFRAHCVHANLRFNGAVLYCIKCCGNFEPNTSCSSNNQCKPTTRRAPGQERVTLEHQVVHLLVSRLLFSLGGGESLGHMRDLLEARGAGVLICVEPAIDTLKTEDVVLEKQSRPKVVV